MRCYACRALAGVLDLRACLGRRFGAALAHGEAPVVELDADDGLDDVLTNQVRGTSAAPSTSPRASGAGGVTSADRVRYRRAPKRCRTIVRPSAMKVPLIRRRSASRISR